jgi:hypothetical protein
MIVESYKSNNHCQELKPKRFHMAMSKLTIKQNGHSSTNENRTDDDYGGGGNGTTS